MLCQFYFSRLKRKFRIQKFESSEFNIVVTDAIIQNLVLSLNLFGIGSGMCIIFYLVLISSHLEFSSGPTNLGVYHVKFESCVGAQLYNKVAPTGFSL